MPKKQESSRKMTKRFHPKSDHEHSDVNSLASAQPYFAGIQRVNKNVDADSSSISRLPYMKTEDQRVSELFNQGLDVRSGQNYSISNKSLLCQKTNTKVQTLQELIQTRFS